MSGMGGVAGDRPTSGDAERVCGGSAWESNPPDRLFAGLTGFEDRAVHQEPTHSREGFEYRRSGPAHQGARKRFSKASATDAAKVATSSSATVRASS